MKESFEIEKTIKIQE